MEFFAKYRFWSVIEAGSKGAGAALFMALIRTLLRSSIIQYYEEKAYHPDVAYKTDSVQLAPGDFCFVCTDGVTDAQNPSGEFFAKENLISMLTRPCDSADAMLDRIRRSLLVHIADAAQFDDITMVLLHRNAAAGSSPEMMRDLS